MTKLIMVLAIVLFTTGAFAGKNDATWNPPKRYDHAFNGIVYLTRLPQKQVIQVCGQFLGRLDYVQHGCSHVLGNKCWIVTVNRTFMKATPQSVLRHELGHCNGWNATHSN